MKTLKKVYDWCLNKVRYILGSINIFLPITTFSKRRSFGKRALQVSFIFAVLIFLFCVIPFRRVNSKVFGSSNTVAMAMCPIINRLGGGSSATGLPAFSYSGSYSVVDDGDGNWRIKFLTSGTFIPSSSMYIDVFLVGGGGSGARDSGSGSGGGGGGYTTTGLVQMQAGTSYSIIIGAGGAAPSGTKSAGAQGGTTSAFDLSAVGGYGGKVYWDEYNLSAGGAGGSGGGGYFQANGGSNGSNGSTSTYDPYSPGGVGQGTTTKEFGETSGTLYSGGGGSFQGLGGSGGGGNGGTSGSVPGVSGTTNTGGGGGGAQAAEAGAGGSGIVVIRNHRAA